jgi:hypothetical protein
VAFKLWWAAYISPAESDSFDEMLGPSIPEAILILELRHFGCIISTVRQIADLLPGALESAKEGQSNGVIGFLSAEGCEWSLSAVWACDDSHDACSDTQYVT